MDSYSADAFPKLSANDAAAGVSALDLGKDDTSFTTKGYASGFSVSELNLEVEQEIKRLENRRRSRSPSTSRKSARNGISNNTAKNSKLDLASPDAFPTLGGTPGIASKHQSKSLFAAYANVAPIANQTRSVAGHSVNPAHHVSSVSVELADFVPTMAPTPSGPTSALAAEVKHVQSKTMTKVSMNRRDGIVVFNVRGPNPDDVEIAKRMLIARVSPKITATINVPYNLRSRIVGQGGKIIQGITMRTQVSIDLERPKSFEPVNNNKVQASESTNSDPSNDEASADDIDGEDDQDGEILEDNNDEPMSTIKFTGDAQGIELAKAEVHAIVGHHVATKRAKLSTKLIPTSIYPFLIGADGSTVTDIENKYGVKITIPSPLYVMANRKLLSPDSDTVEIIGEESNVRAAVTGIKSLVTDLIENIGELSMPVDKRKHKFILGPSSSNLHELLAATGCIIELPPASDANNNQVTVRGPSNQLPTALQMIMAKATSIQAADLDLTPYVAGARSTNTATVYAQYLDAKDRIAIKNIETATGAQVFFPRGSDAGIKHTLEVAGPSKQVVETFKKQLAAHLLEKGSFFYVNVPIAREVLQHTKVNAALAKSREELAAGGLVLDHAYLENTEFVDELTLAVFDPAHGPSSAKKGHTKSTAPLLKEKAAEDILKAAQSVAEFTTQRISIAAKYHRYFAGVKGSKLNELIVEYSKVPEFPLIVRVGSGPKKSTTEDRVPVELGEDEILIRGIKSEVEALITHLKDVKEQAKNAEVKGNHEIEFTVPAKFAPQLVGRGGAGLQPYREKLGINKLEVGTPEADQIKVVLRGTKEAVTYVKNALQKRVEELADLTTTLVKIPNEYHGKIIGEKGKYVKRLNDKYAVRIEFPRSDSTEDPNTITVRGGKKSVKGAVAEILELYEYEKSNNHTESMVVPAFVIPTLVGKSGVHVIQLKQLTGARIDLPPNRRSATPASSTIDDVDTESSATVSNENVTLVGTKDEVTLAKQVVKELIHVLRTSGYGWPSITVEVPSSLHSRIIGPGTRTLRELLAPFNKQGEKRVIAGSSSASQEIKALVRTIYGLSADRVGSNDRVDIRFPKDGRDLAIIKGETMNLIQKVKAALDKKVIEIQDETSLLIQLPTGVFPSLIGAGGAGVRELQSKYKVSINFEQTQVDSKDLKEYAVPEDRDDLREGKLGSVIIRGVSKAAEACATAVLAKVPFTKTILIPATHKRAFLANGAAELRKIRGFGVMLSTPPKNTVTAHDDESWTLRGDKAKVDKVIVDINAILKLDPVSDHGASSGGPTLDVVNTVDDIESHFHRFIIGPGGQTISEIRAATSTVIDVPRQNENKGHAIVIRGTTPDDVYEAERMIREAVDRGANRG